LHHKWISSDLIHCREDIEEYLFESIFDAIRWIPR
jgi:hypothetical protein